MVFVLLASALVASGGAEHYGDAGMVCLAGVVFVGLMSGLSVYIHGGSTWWYGVVMCLLAAPYVLGGWVLEAEGMEWESEVYLVIYLVETVLAVWLAVLVRVSDMALRRLAVFAMSVFGFAMFASTLTLDEGYQTLALSVWSMGYVVYGAVGKVAGVLEVGIYLACMTLCKLIDWGGGLRFDDAMVPWAHIVAAGLVGVSIWRERGMEVRKTRLMVAVWTASIVMACRAIAASGASAAVWTPMFLVEQVAIVIAGGLMRQRWMWIFGASGVGLAILWFVREMTFLWLIMLGMALIVLVVWRLRRAGGDGQGSQRGQWNAPVGSS